MAQVSFHVCPAVLLGSRHEEGGAGPVPEVSELHFTPVLGRGMRGIGQRVWSLDTGVFLGDFGAAPSPLKGLASLSVS